jgi:glutathionyl-hydroquinone reductase
MIFHLHPMSAQTEPRDDATKEVNASGAFTRSGPLDATKEVNASGAFTRSASSFRERVCADGPFPAERGRYVLYVSFACPWASRVLMARVLKGLEDVIEVAVVAPVWRQTRPEEDAHRGWVFDPAACAGGTADPVFGAATLREVYERAGGQGATKYTVPLLVDRVAKRIVNNESSDLLDMLNSEFDGLAAHPEVNYRPASLVPSIDAVNEDVYDRINNGVYRCGFATKQAPYDEAVTALFAALDTYEARLRTQRYLVLDGGEGPSSSSTSSPVSVFTEADIRLFVTLVRHDQVYHTHFKCNRGLISRDYPVLAAYVRDIYQHRGMGKATVDMRHIKSHYYGSHPTINAYGIVPVGPPMDLEVPHGREGLR